jgi:hypothetical protein
MAQWELVQAPTPVEFNARVGDRLSDLQADLGRLSIEMDQARMGAVREMRDRLAELRLQAAEVAQQTGAQSAEAREELSESVGELTRDVRQQVYRTNWGTGTG